MESDVESDVAPVKRRRSGYDSDDPSERSYDSSEENDDEEETPQKHGKRHRDFRAVRNLFIDEAEAVDEDEEEEDDDGDDAELLGHEEDEAIQSAVASARDLEARNRMKELTEQDAECLERYFQQRYEPQNYASHRFGEGAGMTASIVQQERVPDIKDPNLWVVRCQMGEEKATVLSLMRKFLAFQLSDTPLQIKSVFAKEGLKGHIYIEAFKQTHVKQALEGISALSRAQFEQKLVPINEMIDVLNVVKETAQLKPKQWVRLKSGLYKDDLAQVESVKDAQNLVRLKLVPRIDYDRKRNRFDDGDGGEGSAQGSAPVSRKGRWKRPPAALFDPSKVADRISNSGSFVVFEGNQYDSAGFLRKDFRINAVIADGIRPTLGELERFNQLPDGAELAAAAATVATKNVSSIKLGANGEVISSGHGFMPGDIIEVCDGELKNLRGTVLSVEVDDRVIVQPSHHDLKEPIPFNPTELRKYFEQGDRVKVIHGRYENETGLLLVYEPNLCMVLPDRGMSEIRVAPKDLRLWQDRGGPTDGGQSDGAQLMDFVQIDSHNFGVVTQVDRESVSILTCLGKVVTVKANTALRVMKFGGPRGVQPQALDRNGNVIQIKDSVRFLEKPYTGIVGEIKYIYRSWVFVYCRTHVENAGILVSKSRQLAQVGGTGNRKDGGLSFSHSTRPPAVQPLSGQRGCNPRGPNQFDRSIIGKTARIVAGTLKGLTGIICDATSNEVLLELHSQFKKVHVLRQNVGLLDSSGHIIADQLGASVATPRATSVREARTPMAGSMTPHAPSMTPRADATPLPYAFNPSMATPAHFMNEDGQNTPGYQPWQTPDHHRTPRSSHSIDDEEDE
ncbi:Transcription elongation factor SPT5 [Taenia crassiceps]|uniref:Transcription elongation factor SPT5 n=1 Tax=Taenia crassiceps TaxID=6207 RepID=A0ABR4QVT3_9CEST